MMKHQAITLLKFKLLTRRLKLPLWQVVGILETLWLFAQINARDGDLTPFGAEGIAAWLEWEGDSEVLLSALVNARWLDREGERLLIHDWEDHKPNWMKATAASPRTKKRVASLSESQSVLLSDTHGVPQREPQSVPLSATPPIPEPKPTPKPRPERGKTPSPPDVDLPPSIATDAMKAAVGEWLDYKRERREAYRPTGLRAFLAELTKAVASEGEPAVIAKLSRAMASNWQGWSFASSASRGSPSPDRATTRDGFEILPLREL